MKLTTSIVGYVFGGGKHIGKTMEQVAAEDPMYLNWFFREETYPLSDHAYQALVELMTSKGIPFERVRKPSQNAGQ